MQKMIKRYDDLSIKIKFISVILLTLFIFGCVCIAGQQIVNHSNQELLYNTLATSLSYSAKEIKDSMEELESISFNIIVDGKVQGQLADLKEQPEEPIVRTAAYRQLNTVLQNYYAQNSSIGYIRLYGETMNVDTNTIWAERISEAAREEMRETAIAAEGRVKWVFQPEAENPLFLVRSVNRIEPHWLDTLGVVAINIDMQDVVENSAEFDGKFGETFYRLMDAGDTLYQTENFPDGIGSELEELDENKYKIIKKGEDRYFAVSGTIPHYNWKYVHLISYNDMHNAAVRSLLLYLLVVISGALFSVIFCHTQINRLIIHISTLLGKMQDFSKNNEEVPETIYDYSERKDELGLLHRKFDDMASEIIYLIQNDYKNKLLMKDSQLKALEAQIDPHFLYNVLQSISWSAKEIGDNQIPMMVDSLGKMLRTTLGPEDERFTVAKEMEFIGYYMTIQQFRFEGQLDFTADIPDQMLSVRIPKLTVQPLVENAIRYSMEACEEVCLVELIGEIKEDEMTISVKNSGSKFPEDLLNKLENKQITPNGFGIGILNIQKRLQLFCKGEAYLELKNEDDMAVAIIHIPASHYKEDT